MDRFAAFSQGPSVKDDLCEAGFRKSDQERRGTISDIKDQFRDDPDTDRSGLQATLSTNRNAFLGFLVKRLGNRTDAEDVLQEFCVVFWRARISCVTWIAWMPGFIRCSGPLSTTITASWADRGD